MIIYIYLDFIAVLLFLDLFFHKLQFLHYADFQF